MSSDRASPSPVPSPEGALRRSSADLTASERAWTWIDRRRPGSEGGGRTIDLRWIDARLARLAPEISRPPAAVTMVLVDDGEMDRLHRLHSGVAGTTDVLTFPDDDAPRGGGAVGDVVLCVDVAFREATERGRRLEHELLLYAVHGLLHLAGGRDDHPAGAEAMHREQDRLLALVDLPPMDAEAPR